MCSPNACKSGFNANFPKIIISVKIVPRHFSAFFIANFHNQSNCDNNKNIVFQGKIDISSITLLIAAEQLNDSMHNNYYDIKFYREATSVQSPKRLF